MTIALALTAILLQPPPAPAPAGAAAATAVVRGHVFAADSGQPLRKAQVRLSRIAEARQDQSTVTDADGAFEFTGLRAGRYLIQASKGSYVSVSYGQQRSTDAPKPIEIADGQLVERLDLSLPRGGVITGRVVDEIGEAVPGVEVSAQRYQFVMGRRQLTPAGHASSTNDLGEFRVFGVAAGQYYLMATWRNPAGMGPSGNPRDRLAYAATYFPGTTNVAEAQRISIGPGRDVTDLPLTLTTIRAARVSGTATGADGKPMTSATIMVAQTGGALFSFAGSAQVRPDGTFTVSGLGPGDYTLRAQRNGPPTDGPESAAATISVNGEDIADLQLVAARPSRATGRLIVDPGAGGQLPRPVTLMLMPMAIAGFPPPPPPPVRVADDSTFELAALPGRMRVILGGFAPSPSGWTIRMVRVNGVDVTDSGIEFKPNENIGDVEVELTNRSAAISGSVADSRGQPSKEYTAIVFAQDKEKWTFSSRYQGAGRPDQDGRFKITGLPPGEYYIVAVDRVEAGQQGDPEFLESVRDKAARFSLGEGETKTIDLTLNGGS